MQQLFSNVTNGDLEKLVKATRPEGYTFTSGKNLEPLFVEHIGLMKGVLNTFTNNVYFGLEAALFCINWWVVQSTVLLQTFGEHKLNKKQQIEGACVLNVPYIL